jgi:hypothetical protein
LKAQVCNCDFAGSAFNQEAALLDTDASTKAAETNEALED